MYEVIFGIHPIRAILDKSPDRLQKVFIFQGKTDQRLSSLVSLLKSYTKIQINLAQKKWFDNTVGKVVHQGIVAYVKNEILFQEQDLPNIIANIKQPFLLILDRITDPHNLGACLRNAAAAGVHVVIITKDRSASLNATVRKVACGAAEHVPLIRVTNLTRTIKLIKEHNIWVMGTDISAKDSLYQKKIIGSIALVLGNEYTGMRQLISKQCDELISIPIFGSINSLNVASAAAVCLFEIVRQRWFT